MVRPDFDVVIVGAGFAGIYQLYTIVHKLHLKVVLLESGSDVGGTWYWNRYPGATSDVHSHIYRFSWDKEDLLTYPWANSYLSQREVQKYLAHVVDKYDLRQYIRFDTPFHSADWDDGDKLWTSTAAQAKKLTSRYLITATGALTQKITPNIRDLDVFKGEIYYTSAWPVESPSFKDKRVGIVGNGSSGSQLLAALAADGSAKHLISFQRSPQLSVPNGNRAVTEEERAHINNTYNDIWTGVRDSNVAFGFQESTVPTFSVSEEERTKRFQEAWDQGNGFYFMFGVFSDTTKDRKANEAARDFIKSKVREIVQDPETQRKLIPKEPYGRRPICNDGYYEAFNKDNVSLVSLRETPFVHATADGIVTSDGKEHTLDILIFATGFDVVTGWFDNHIIRGRHGITLQEHWKEAPKSYFGFSMSSFPNLFTISGPLHAFTNAPPQIEAQVDFVTGLIQHVGLEGTVEATADSEEEWIRLCNEVVEGSILHEAGGWAFGDNVDGKKHNVLFFMGGLKRYRELQAEEAAKGYSGFKFERINR